jgi:hypothetical protein
MTRTMRSFLHGLGLALMMGRLVVLWPFCGLSSKQARVFIWRTFFVMVHVGLGLSFGPGTLWANAYKLGLS